MNRNRKPFYANEMHNDSHFSVHQYFTTANPKPKWSANRYFVDAPSPFGVDNTYKYLRKVNLDKLPYVTEAKGPKKRLSLGANLITNTESSFKTPKTQIKSSASSSPERVKRDYLLKACIFSEIGEIKNFWEHCVEINLMKYLKSCFLKCKLELDTLTLDEYRVIEMFILPALRHRKNRPLHDLQSPLALLGILEMETKKQFLEKLKELHAEDKHREIYQLIEHFILPEDEIMEHQLEAILQEVNRIYKFKKIIKANEVNTLFLLDGTPVDCLFQLTTNNPIVIAAPKGIKPKELHTLRESLKLELKRKDKISRENWIKSIVKADRSSSKSQFSATTKPRSYDEVEELLRKRQRAGKFQVKDKFSLIKVKTPFFTKDELVREYDIFEQ